MPNSRLWTWVRHDKERYKEKEEGEMRNLLQTLEHWVKLNPNKELVIDVDNDVRYTYAQVYDRAKRLAGGLKKLGVKKGARIANMMYNSYIYYDLYYGLSAGGYILVPLNLRLSPQELIYQINDSGASVLLFDPDFSDTVLKIKNEINVKHFVCTYGDPPFEGVIKYDDLINAEPYVAEVEEQDLFGIYYTGGTTGKAKGVMLSHKNIISNAVHLILTTGMRGDHIALHAAPMFHLADGAVNFGVTLVGGTHVLVKRFEPLAVMEAIQKEKVTCTLLVPTMINMVINHPAVKEYDFSSMRIVFYGASPIAPDVLKRAIDVFDCDFIQLYGMTEAGPILTILLPEDHKKPELLSAAGRQAIGVEVRVVDENGNDVAPGGVGEVIARGDNIMVGYWGKPLQTEEVLRDRWYWTQDLARIDENNYIYIVDRAKDMIISGGENIYSVEVEAVIYKHPAVLEVAVVGAPDEKWGEVVKAVVVLKPGKEVDEKELIDFCKQHIASYKVPKSIDFVEELPKSGAGKILKRVIRDKYWKGRERRVA